jgi:hypothetical protein
VSTVRTAKPAAARIDPTRPQSLLVICTPTVTRTPAGVDPRTTSRWLWNKAGSSFLRITTRPGSCWTITPVRTGLNTPTVSGSMMIDPGSIITQAPIGPAPRSTRIFSRKGRPIWLLDNPWAALMRER